jgi:hypothetical protein
MPPAGFGPAIPAIKWLQTHALDNAATGIGINYAALSKCHPYGCLHAFSHRAYVTAATYCWLWSMRLLSVTKITFQALVRKTLPWRGLFHKGQFCYYELLISSVTILLENSWRVGVIALPFALPSANNLELQTALTRTFTTATLLNLNGCYIYRQV